MRPRPTRALWTPDDERDDALARNPPPNLDNFAREAQLRVARMAFLISKHANARNGTPIDQEWEQMSDAQRDASARGTLRIVQAMVLLGWIAPP